MHIDWWTLGLQAINVLILVWLLARFFYRPLVSIIEQRRSATAKVVADADAARKAADAEKTEIAATRSGFAAERDKLLADARAQVARESDAMLKQAAADTARQRTELEADLARDRQAMEHLVTRHAATLAVEIARRLLASLPGGISASLFVEGLSEQIGALSPRSRELLMAAAAREGGLVLVSAAPLDDASQDACQKALDGMLGISIHPAFLCDPALIAGIELRSDTIVLKNNWAADIGRIRQDLGSDDGQRHDS